MEIVEPTQNDLTQQRLKSLDLFRGVIMFLLVAETTQLYHFLLENTTEGTLWHGLTLQLTHHPWNGLRFWDLIQPFFMFIVGVAMVFSLRKRVGTKADWNSARSHIFKRCLILFGLGVLLHWIYNGRVVWELWNVLTQLSFTILVAFLIFRWSIKWQIITSLALLLLTELLYRLFPLEGFDQPFVMGKNFGSWMDLVLMGKINSHGWVAINCIPTAAHTIWGVVAGKVLLAKNGYTQKIKSLLIAGIIGLVVGYGLDYLGITPIIKRISTSSFTLASGGWCLIALAFCFWLVDVKKYNSGVWFFSVVGMNSIFIYMFTQSIGHQWVNGFAGIFTTDFLKWLHAPDFLFGVSAALVALTIHWYLCYWMYKKKVFIKV